MNLPTNIFPGNVAVPYSPLNFHAQIGSESPPFMLVHVSAQPLTNFPCSCSIVFQTSAKIIIQHHAELSGR